MAVPEASVNEYHSPIAWQDNVRLSGKPAVVQTIPQPSGEQPLSDQKLRRGIGPTDAGHHAATGCLIDYVHGSRGQAQLHHSRGLKFPEIHDMRLHYPGYFLNDRHYNCVPELFIGLGV